MTEHSGYTVKKSQIQPTKSTLIRWPGRSVLIWTDKEEVDPENPFFLGAHCLFSPL